MTHFIYERLLEIDSLPLIFMFIFAEGCSSTTMLNSILSLLTIKTVLVGLLTGLIVNWLIKRFKYKLPPGPFPLPLVGNLLQFKTEMLHEQMYEWSKTFGPVISIYLGPVLVVVVNDIQSATEVLVKKGSDFAGRIMTPSIDIGTDGAKDIAFGQYGPTWKMHRKIAGKALRHFMLGDAFEEKVHKAFNLVSEEFKNIKTSFNPEEHIDLMICNILISVLFGGEYELRDPEIRRHLDIENEAVDRIFSGMGILEDRIPGLKYIWETSNMKWLKSAAEEIKNMFMPMLREHEKTFDRNNVRDFADSLILARIEAEHDPDATNVDRLTDLHMYQTCRDIFAAGIDTSRHTLRYAILHMVAYPDIQAKVQEEIDRVVGRNELPKLCHRPNLGYTEAVLHESMRFSVALPTAVPHKTTCDTLVGGYDVPKGTMVIINIWALHHDPKAWNNVDDFIPERFLDKDEKLGPKPESWLPFSAGTRVCLGEPVAKPALLLLFAALMQRFTWRIPEGKKIDLSPNGNIFSIFPKPHELLVEERIR